MGKKLYRSNSNKMLCGVCAGIAEFFGIDATVIRLLWVVASVFLTFILGGIILYFICAAIIPQDPGYTDI